MVAGTCAVGVMAMAPTATVAVTVIAAGSIIATTIEAFAIEAMNTVVRMAIAVARPPIKAEVAQLHAGTLNNAIPFSGRRHVRSAAATRG